MTKLAILLVFLFVFALVKIIDYKFRLKETGKNDPECLEC